jgi:hypothetical protein
MSAPPRPPPSGPPPPGYDPNEDHTSAKNKNNQQKGGRDAVIPKSRQAPKRPVGSKPAYNQNSGATKRNAGPPGKAPPTHAPPIAASATPGAPPVVSLLYTDSLQICIQSMCLILTNILHFFLYSFYF